jgi:hypothetical protein
MSPTKLYILTLAISLLSAGCATPAPNSLGVSKHDNWLRILQSANPSASKEQNMDALVAHLIKENQ